MTKAELQKPPRVLKKRDEGTDWTTNPLPQTKIQAMLNQESDIRGQGINPRKRPTPGYLAQWYLTQPNATPSKVKRLNADINFQEATERSLQERLERV